MSDFRMEERHIATELALKLRKGATV